MATGEVKESELAQFKKDFAILYRNAVELSNSLKLYNGNRVKEEVMSSASHTKLKEWIKVSYPCALEDPCNLIK